MSPPRQCCYKYSLQTHVENPTWDLLGKTQRLRLSVTLLLPHKPFRVRNALDAHCPHLERSCASFLRGKKGGGELGMLIRNKVQRSKDISQCQAW